MKSFVSSIILIAFNKNKYVKKISSIIHYVAKYKIRRAFERNIIAPRIKHYYPRYYGILILKDSIYQKSCHSFTSIYDPLRTCKIILFVILWYIFLYFSPSKLLVGD